MGLVYLGAAVAFDVVIRCPYPLMGLDAPVPMGLDAPVPMGLDAPVPMGLDAPVPIGVMMRIMSTRHARNLLVWLHVVTTVAWMSQALALLALLITGLSTGDAGTRLSAYSMAEVLDDKVLVPMANAAIFTGLMLSALTPWGYFQYWWVLTKFVITITQLYVGIFILSPRLVALAQAVGQGHAGSPQFLIVASLLMASAITFQAWLSVAKPWKRTPWTDSAGKPKKSPSGPNWMFLFSTGVPIFDYLFGTFVLGFPLPLLSLVTVIGYPIWRAHQLQLEKVKV